MPDVAGLGVKTVESATGPDVDVALGVFSNAPDRVTGKSIGRR